MSTSELDSLSVDLNKDTFLKTISHGTWLVKHYAPWCPHCQALAPHWAKLSKDYKSATKKTKFHFGEVNCVDQSQLCDDNGVKGYPSIFLYHRGEKVGEYNGPTHEPDELNVYLQNVTTFDFEHPENNNKFNFEKLSIEEKHRLSVPLFEKTFDIIDKWSFGFINFCDFKKESCKEFEPTWFELSNDLNSEIKTKGLNLAHVDCDTDSKFCKEQTIKDNPTLKLFSNSTFVTNYPVTSNKNLESIKKFLIEKIEEQKKTSLKKTPASEKPPTVELPPDHKKPSSDSLDKTAPDDAEIELHSKFVSRSSYLGSGNFTELTNEGIWFIQFRSPTPGSQPIDSKWAHLSNDFSLFLTKYGVRFGTLECSVEKEFCEKNGAKSFPAVQTYEFGEQKSTYDGIGTYDDLKAYIRENTHKLRSDSTLPTHDFSDGLLPGIQGKTIPLVESTFHELTSQGPWFVFFKTTTCKSCRTIVPDWEDLALRYKKKLNFATVDCTKEKPLCDKLGVNKYPTFTFYKDGASREYHGPYTVESFDQFANTASAPHLQLLDSNSLKAVSKKESSYFLYIYNELDSDSLASLKPIVKGIYLNTDMHIISSQKATGIKVPSKLPALQVYHNDRLFSEYTESIDEVEKVKEWLNKAQFGPTIPLDTNNFDLVMSYYDSVVLAVVEPVKDQGSIKQYKDLANSYITQSTSKVGFGILDGIQWKEYIERVYQRSHKDLPFVVVTHPKSNVYETNLPNGEPIPFSGAVLTKHVEEFTIKHADKTLSSQDSSNSSFTTFLLIFLFIGFVVGYYRHRSWASRKNSVV